MTQIFATSSVTTESSTKWCWPLYGRRRRTNNKREHNSHSNNKHTHVWACHISLSTHTHTHTYTNPNITWIFIVDRGLKVLMRSPIHFSLTWELVIIVPAHPVRFIPEYQSVTLSQKKTPLSTNDPYSPDRRARFSSFSFGYSKSIRPSYCTEKRKKC